MLFGKFTLTLFIPLAKLIPHAIYIVLSKKGNKIGDTHINFVKGQNVVWRQSKSLTNLNFICNFVVEIFSSSDILVVGNEKRL